MRNMTKVLAVVAFLAVPMAATAQATASVQATANVLAQLSASGERDLEFVDLIPGFVRTVAPSSADAGRLRVQGGGSSEVQLSFTLPAELDHDSDPAAKLPISFGAGSAGHGANSTTVDATFDPAAGVATPLVDGELHVFVGGTVSPTAGQLAGAYGGTITLDVSYTGN
jgi:hypothetical protein